MTIATASRAPFTIRRSFPSSIEEVWKFWTTAAGIEAWWGPEGFDVRVASLVVQPGGTLNYMMTAVADDQVAFMRQAGMPLTTDCRVTYTEVTPPRRLSYTTLADFVPGVDPYEVATLVEFEESGGITDVVITYDAMHDDVWTERMRAGVEGQMRKLGALTALLTAGGRP